MSQMMEFWEFILSSLPDFLLSEPIVYFVGLYILLVIVGVVQRIIHIHS